MKYYILLNIMLVSASFGETLFRTDFSEVLGDKTYVELKLGGFEEAKAEPGTFYGSKGVAFASASKTGSWPPPPDTAGGAARMGFAYKGDFQLRLALPEKWDATLKYTLTVRHRAWSKEGKPDGDALGMLKVMLGCYEGYPDWLVSNTYIPLDGKEWTTTTLEVLGSEIGQRAGKQIVFRLQKKEPCQGGDITVWIDSIELSAVPEEKSRKKK